jgi:hypothetical protein
MPKTALRAKDIPARRLWSKDDMKLLKSMAQKEPLAKIARALNRTAGATRQRAAITGVSLKLSKKATSAKK